MVNMKLLGVKMEDFRELKRNNEVNILLQKELKTQRRLVFFMWIATFFNLAGAIFHIINVMIRS